MDYAKLQVGEIFTDKESGNILQAVDTPTEGMLFRDTDGILYEYHEVSQQRGRKCACAERKRCLDLTLRAFGKCIPGLWCRVSWPREHDRYFFVNSILMVDTDIYNTQDSLSKVRKAAGNFFKTKEEAEFAKDRVRAVFLDIQREREDKEKGLDLF